MRDELAATAETVLQGARGTPAAAETVVQGGATAPRVAPQTVIQGSGSTATLDAARVTRAPARTVLPRVAVVGDARTLIHDDRARYEPLGQLGQGGVGEVLRTRDHDIGRDVAVKRLRPEMRDQAALIRFVDEIRTVGQLEHPNIVPIHDVGVDERGEPFFVMKFVGGETLESIIRKLAAGDPEYHRRLPFERRVEVFTKICEAVRYAHANGIIHRDLKPANVMVGEFGEVLVMDWGLAKRIGTAEPAAGAAAAPADPGLTAQGALLGTPAYMAPEQARGQPADERSDVYSLCVMFHELLCLRHYLADKRTFAEVLAGVLTETAPIASRVTSPHQALPPMDLSWFVRRGLNKVPAARYPSVAAMLERLARRREGDIPIECHITFLKRASTAWIGFMERHPLLVTVGLGLLLVALVALGVRALL
jgi:serine/threonine-protein kinase